MLAAVLEKRIGLNLADQDIFLNVVGGIKIMDPAADLAIVLAIASAFQDKIIPFDTVVMGEVGLSAEVRSISQIGPRINEAEKLGFKRCIVPQNNLNGRNGNKNDKIAIIGVDSLKKALEII